MDIADDIDKPSGIKIFVFNGIALNMLIYGVVN